MSSHREAIRAARAAAQRRRRTVLLALLSVATAAALVATDLPSGPLPGPVVAAGRAVAAAVGPAAPAAATPFTPGPAAAASPAAGTPASGAAAYTHAATSQDPDRADAEPAPSGTSGSAPTVGTGTFSVIPGPGPVAGLTGQMLRFHVAVEEGAGQDDAAFAAAVDAILADPRGWTREGLRFQRVSEPTAAAFTIFLASPLTSESMCAAGGLQTEGYSSCRLPGHVIINSARWTSAVPNYGAPVGVYQAYAINHEVGHELGYGHEACPGPGRPAPVMQQQTYGLRDCTAYAWPYLNGVRYTGPPVP